MKLNIKNLSWIIFGVSIIFLFIFVGTARILVPKIDEYSENLKSWANEESDYKIDFSRVKIEWTLNGPELIFLKPEIKEKISNKTIISTHEVRAEIDVFSFLLDRSLALDQLKLNKIDLHLSYTKEDGFLLQDIDYALISSFFDDNKDETIVFSLIGKEIRLHIDLPNLNQNIDLMIPEIIIDSSHEELKVDTFFDVPEKLGESLLISASKRVVEDGPSLGWRLYIEGESLNINDWLNFFSYKIKRDLHGIINIDAWLELNLNGLERVTADLSIDDFFVDDNTNDSLDLKSRFEFSANDFGWFAAADKLQFSSKEGTSSESRVQLQAQNNGETTTLDTSISLISLEDLKHFRSWIDQENFDYLYDLNPKGLLRDIRLNISDLDEITERFDFSTQFDGVSLLFSDNLRSITSISEINGMYGEFFFNQAGGRIEMDSKNMHIVSQDYTDDGLLSNKAKGSIIWRTNSKGLRVLSDQIDLENSVFKSSTSIEMSWLNSQRLPYIDIDSHWNIDDVQLFKGFLPKKTLNPVLYQWVQDAFLSGRIKHGRTRIIGLLENFPFKNKEGIFRITAEANEMILRYAKGWPNAKIHEMEFEMDGNRMFSSKNYSIHAGIELSDAIIEIKDLSNPILEFNINSSSDLIPMNNFLMLSPVNNYFGGMLEDITASGAADYEVDIRLPLRIVNRDQYDFDTKLDINDASLQVDGIDPSIENLQGSLYVSRSDVASKNLRADWLGSQITIDASKADEDNHFINSIISLEGTTSISNFEKRFNFSFNDSLRGTSNYQVDINIPKYDITNPKPFFVKIRSKLNNIDINLPAPFEELSKSSKVLDTDLFFPTSGVISIQGGIDSDVNWSVNYSREEVQWVFDRGILAFGHHSNDPLDSRGLHIRGQTNKVNLNNWLDLTTSDTSEQDISFKDLIRSVDLSAKKFNLFGRSFKNQRIVMNKGSNEWIIDVFGSDAEGLINLPYLINDEQPIELDMKVLNINLPEGDWTSSFSDPRQFPPIAINIDNFSFSNHHFGSIRADFDKFEDGLRAVDINTQDDSFAITANAGWVVDESSGMGVHTYLDASLASTNVADTLLKLDYQPIIDSNDMKLDIDVKWQGGPREDYLEYLQGEVGVRIGAGQLEEVNPGAGRVFGLLSIVALPRRLSLDFRDVIDKGFGFDEILGTFNVKQGRASTCNLSLKGPAADIGILGSVDLVGMNYKQKAIVSTNFGNTLPIVGAVVAGPPAAAALLLFSQIFKKPLQEMAQIYYDIGGSFDDPNVENINADSFARMINEYECSL